MRRIRKWSSVLLVVSILMAVVSCAGNLVNASLQRITFALVIDSRAYNGVNILADVLDDFQGNIIESVSDPLASYPNTANHAWARLTTLGEHPTNRRYVLEFYLDLDGDGTLSSGDLAGVQHFDVMPNAVWSETKFFSDDLETVP